MSLTLEQQVQAAFNTYRMNPSAFCKVIRALIEGEVETRNKEQEKDLAFRKCRKLHEARCEEVVCAECSKSEEWIAYARHERAQIARLRAEVEASMKKESEGDV